MVSFLLSASLGLISALAPAALQAPSGTVTGCLPITAADIASGLDAPGFEQFEEAPDFSRAPSKVDFYRHTQAQKFRTRLTAEAAGGPDFAGHYTIAGWSCGLSCLQFAIIDAKTGKVHFPPGIKSVNTLRVDVRPNEPSRKLAALRYRVDSRLLVVLGAPNGDESLEGIAYYEWTGKTLKRLTWRKSQKFACQRPQKK